MSSGLAVLLVVCILIVLLLLRMPVWLALAISGGAGLFMLRNEAFVTSTLATVSFEETSTFSLTIIPMFILLGVFAVRAKIAEQVFTIARHVFKKVPGGIGISTVAACAGFAAVSGSSIGTAATMSQLSVGEMRKAGYPASLAGALVAVAGTLGAMIPPSLFLVLYAIWLMSRSLRCWHRNHSGFLSAVIYAVYILIRTRKYADDASVKPDLEVELEREIGTQQRRQERVRLPYRGLFRLGIIFLIIMGGIYSGLFTPTESAAIGALAALLILVLEFRKQGIRKIAFHFVEALKETAKTTSMVFAVIIGSAILSTFFVVARVPQTISNAVTSLDVPDWLIMALLLALLLPLGMALESISILVITVPLIYPVAMDMGFDGVWLGVMIIKLIEIGMVTPPVGINVFVVAGTARIPTMEVFRGVWPFVLLELLLLAVFFAWPDMLLWLPSLVQ